MEVRQPDHEWTQGSWHVHYFREETYVSWVLYHHVGEEPIYVACGAVVDGKASEIEREVGPGIPRIGKRLLREIERAVDGMGALG